MSQTRTTVLGGCAVALTVCLVIFVWLDATHHIKVDVGIVITLACLMVAAGTGYIASVCTRAVVQRIDVHDQNMMTLHTAQTEVCEALAGFADAIHEYGTSVVAEDRLDQLRKLAATPPTNGATYPLRAVSQP